MSRECSRLVTCPFFQKYKHLEEAEVNRLKRLFCKGPYMDQCVRKLYKELHGVDPPVQMCPEGKVMKEDLQDDIESCPCIQQMVHYG